MMQNNRNKEQLFVWVTMVHFMMVDLMEYLDTHPTDTAAMDSFYHYSSLYNKAMKEYAALYGPLTISTAVPDKTWRWSLSKNPWERGYV